MTRTPVVCGDGCKPCRASGDGGVSRDQREKTSLCVFSVPKEKLSPDFFTLAAAEAAADEDGDEEEAGQHRHGDD